MKKYKIGIIGYGGFGQFLHHWFNKLENVEVAAIADHGHHTKDTTVCRVYENWKDILTDPEIDIVSIVTPPALHAQMACAAMQAGKHVVLEKPVAITEESAKQIMAVHRETGKIITVNHMIRYNPIIQTLANIGQSGALGKLRHVAVHNYAQDAALPNDHWFWYPEMSGGILIEHGVHFFDIVNMIGRQRFTEVFGACDARSETQRDRVAAMVKYDGGLIADYYHAFSGPGIFEQTTIHLAYDLARIEIEGWMPLAGSIKAMANPGIRRRFSALPNWHIIKTESPERANDASRPEGWGASPGHNPGGETIKFGGVGFEVDEMIAGKFEIAQTKGDVYGRCVQSTLLDVIRKIENPNHTMTVTLEDGIEALKIAILATK